MTIAGFWFIKINQGLHVEDFQCQVNFKHYPIGNGEALEVFEPLEGHDIDDGGDNELGDKSKGYVLCMGN